MKKELPPAVVYLIIAVVVIVVVGLGYKMLGPKNFTPEKSGSEAYQQQVKEGKPLYSPPPGAPGTPQNPLHPGGQ